MKRAAWWVFFIALPALASERVLVVTRSGTLAETSVRVKAELETQGFEVVEATSAQKIDLPRIAGAYQANAVIALERGGAVDVWVIDPVSEKMAVRSLEGAPDVAPVLLARRAVDFVQASFIELSIVPSAAPTIAAAPARLHLSLGAAAVWHPGFDVSLAASADVEVRLTGPLWVGLGLLGPSALGELQGSVRASIQQVGFWASARLHLTPVSWLELAVSAGAGAQYFAARGTAAGDTGGTAWTWTINAELTSTFWFSEHFGARAAFIGSAAPQPVRLLVTGTEVARAATPMVSGAASLALRW